MSLWWSGICLDCNDAEEMARFHQLRVMLDPAGDPFCLLLFGT